MTVSGSVTRSLLCSPPVITPFMPRLLQILAQSFEKRMSDFANGGLGAVLDFGEQLGLNPDAAMRGLLNDR